MTPNHKPSEPSPLPKQEGDWEGRFEDFWIENDVITGSPISLTMDKAKEFIASELSTAHQQGYAEGFMNGASQGFSKEKPTYTLTKETDK